MVLREAYLQLRDEVRASAEAAAIADREKLEAMARAEQDRDRSMLQSAIAKSADLFADFKVRPALIGERFSLYEELVQNEIIYSPKLMGELSISAILQRERERVKEMARIARLPYAVIAYYQDISRRYLGAQREDDLATIYDEQMITNDVIAMKEGFQVQGDYHDHSMSVTVDRSTSHVTTIESAIIEGGRYDLERVKKEIIKGILSAPDEAVSRVELMSFVPVKESMLLAALEELQEKGVIIISNRDSGEVVYRVDRLA